MRRKILCVMPSLEGGGAQRAVLNVVNLLDRSRFDVILALYQVEGPYLSELRDDVRVVDLGAGRFRRAVLPLARVLRRERPDVLLSTMLFPNVVAAAAARLARYRGATILTEVNHWSGAGRRAASWPDRLAGWAYRRATRVIALSRGVAEDCRRRYRLPEARIAVINNPTDVAGIRARAASRDPAAEAAGQGGFSVIGVGRLVPQKGFDLLIPALARLTGVPWRLTLLGEGPERERLEGIARELHVQERVRFPGFQENPFRWIHESDLFVLSSRWEGFGNVIAEAMASGTAVLATRCPSGPDEIITDGVDGLLCEPGSVDALTVGIERLAADPGLRERLAAGAARSVERFDAPRIVAEYEALFEEVSES